MTQPGERVWFWRRRDVYYKDNESGSAPRSCNDKGIRQMSDTVAGSLAKRIGYPDGMFCKGKIFFGNGPPLRTEKISAIAE